MIRYLGILSLLLTTAVSVVAQNLVKTYYDDEQNHIKEEFYVRSDQQNILNGTYTSYYESGEVKSRGQFKDNKAYGVWKYFYLSGGLRMQGEVGDGKNIGLWEYYFENGSTKMRGTLIDGKKAGDWVYYYRNNSIESEGQYEKGKKMGIWKYYKPSGVLSATEEFSGQGSYFEQVYETGTLEVEGKMLNGKRVDQWNFYYEDGTLKARGSYEAGDREGTWQYYDTMGKIEAEGKYSHDLANGIWIYYHSDGSIASKGELIDGTKNGNWKMFYNDGKLKAEADYTLGDGAYNEYYKNGAIKVEGQIKSGMYEGTWRYFYENGNLEGICEFVNGEGKYLGYYNDGALKMKGQLKNEIKTGIWELYEPSGELTGYYKPYYADGESTFFIAGDVKEQKELSQIRRANAGSFKATKKKSRYFNQKFHEFKAFIVGYNPIAPLVGSLPLSFEYYLEERLGYELVAQYLRNPFFRSFNSLADETLYSEGFSITFRQKFYHKEVPIGQPYFAHELKYTGLFHSTNMAGEAVFGAHEQKIEYGALVGTRFFKNSTANGFTVDGYVGFAVGYRLFDRAYLSSDPQNDPFSELNTNDFAYSIRLGINLGYTFRIKK